MFTVTPSRILSSALSIRPSIITTTPRGSEIPISQTPLIAIGCDDGAINILDGTGQFLQLGKVSGRPTCIGVLSVPSDHSVVLIATDSGEVKAFAIGE